MRDMVNTNVNSGIITSKVAEVKQIKLAEDDREEDKEGDLTEEEQEDLVRKTFYKFDENEEQIQN
mgnify:CR=1 FL=1